MIIYFADIINNKIFIELRWTYDFNILIDKSHNTSCFIFILSWKLSFKWNNSMEYLLSINKFHHQIQLNGFYFLKSIWTKWFSFMVRNVLYRILTKVYFISGRNTRNFTATNDLFVNYPEEIYWRFEVIYSFWNEPSMNALNFKINPKPSNETCSINPTNGTIETLFQITCTDWQIQDNTKDFIHCIVRKETKFFLCKSLLYLDWLNDPTKRIIIAFSSVANFIVRLSSGNLNLLIQIRDLINSVTDFNISSIISVLSKQTNNLLAELHETILLNKLWIPFHKNLIKLLMKILIKQWKVGQVINFFNKILSFFFRWNSTNTNLCCIIRRMSNINSSGNVSFIINKNSLWRCSNVKSTTSSMCCKCFNSKKKRK